MSLAMTHFGLNIEVEFEHRGRAQAEHLVVGLPWPRIEPITVQCRSDVLLVMILTKSSLLTVLTFGCKHH